MKNMKKVLCLLLALATVLAFAGCGNKQAPASETPAAETPAPVSDEDQAKAVVEGYINALFTFDAEEAKKYVDDESVIGEAPDVDAIVDALLAEAPMMEDYRGDLTDLLNLTLDTMMANADYKLGDITKDGDNFVIAAEITLPDMTSDPTIALQEAMSEDAMTDVAMKLMDEGKITESTTEEEMFAIIMPEVFKIAEEEIEKMEFETATTEGKFVVVKNGDNWVIDTEASDLD